MVGLGVGGGTAAQRQRAIAGVGTHGGLARRTALETEGEEADPRFRVCEEAIEAYKKEVAAEGGEAQASSSA